MALIERMLKYDYCVYWAPTGRKTKFGDPLFELPVEIGCRWEEGIVVTRNPDGTERVFNGKVYVGIDVDVDGQLWHGRLVDVPNVEDPSKPPEDAQLILRFDKMPNLRNTKKLRTVSI